MKKSLMNPKVDAFLDQASRWRDEMTRLRAIILNCGLVEELKWGMPCYTFQGKNVVIIQGFKAYCALLFFKGALLKDANGILIKTGENTHVGRQIRFTQVQEITRQAAMLKAYVHEAIAVEKSGVKVAVARQPKPVPVELQNKWAKKPALKQAFEALTPGRQRAYIFYFSAPKQAKTRESRIEKCLPQILKGKGLQD